MAFEKGFAFAPLKQADETIGAGGEASVHVAFAVDSKDIPDSGAVIGENEARGPSRRLPHSRCTVPASTDDTTAVSGSVEAADVMHVAEKSLDGCRREWLGEGFGRAIQVDGGLKSVDLDGRVLSAGSQVLCWVGDA